MHRGGIFTGLSSLGSPVGLGDAAQACTFATGVYSAGAKALQQLLISMGATKLKADGLWGPCSESAYEQITGEPLTQASVMAHYGINCSPYVKNVVGKSCSNGSDAVTPMVTVDPNQPVQTPPGPGTTTGGATTASLVPGVSNLMLFGGVAVVLLGTLAYFSMKAPSPAAATTAAANRKRWRRLDQWQETTGARLTGPQFGSDEKYLWRHDPGFRLWFTRMRRKLGTEEAYRTATAKAYWDYCIEKDPSVAPLGRS